MPKLVKVVTHHEKTERAAQLFSEDRVVAIGFVRRESIEGKTKDQIKQILVEEKSDNPEWGASQLVAFRDEINRGHLSKILGELTHCLEYPGRHNTVTLPYSQQSFFIPENVYVIGTMNSADRSIALVDFALRRRFHFIEFLPNVDVLAKWFEKNPGNVNVQKVVTLLNKMNERISADDKLGKYYQIGHSYFMHKGLDEAKLSDVWTYDVVPMLEEYFFEDRDELAVFQKMYVETFGPT